MSVRRDRTNKNRNASRMGSYSMRLQGKVVLVTGAELVIDDGGQAG
jgi:hypothetical protein